VWRQSLAVTQRGHRKLLLGDMHAKKLRFIEEKFGTGKAMVHLHTLPHLCSKR
jgi:hypothetical protein